MPQTPMPPEAGETGTVPATCKREGCHKLVEQVPGGHRHRQYCSDTCKQSDYRRRAKEKQLARRQAELRERWGELLSETLELLDIMLRELGEEMAQRMAATIIAEKQQPRVSLSAEQARERARLHSYLNEGRYLASTQHLFIRLFQTGQVEPHEVREVINHERGAEGDRLRCHIAELEQAVEAERRRVEELERKVARQQATSEEIDAEIERRHQQLVELLVQQGKRLKYPSLLLSSYTVLFHGLIDASEIGDIKAGRSNWEDVVSFSPEGLIVAILCAYQVERVEQLLKQEQRIASEQIWRYKLAAEDAQRDERASRSRYYQVKERLEEAERDLARYRQLCDLDDRQQLLTQAAALGAQIGYTSLLAIEPPVRAGEASWGERLQHADNEDLARIVAVAKHFAENLIWLEVHDELQRAQRRIAELERQVEHNRLSAVSSQPNS